jgi:hypothetical protein
MRIKATALTSALAVLALAAAAAADHKPGHDPGQGASDVTIAATTPIVWGRSTVLVGRVRGAGTGILVDLEGDTFPYSDAEWAKQATVATDSKGDYRFTAMPRSNTRYRAVAFNSPTVTSAAVTVLVQIRAKVRVSDSTPKRGSLVKFSGSACPAHDGNLVYVQKRSSTGRFGTVGRTKLVDAGETCSSYSRRVRVYSDGVYRVKVSSGGDGDHMTGVSRTVSLDAHR